MKQSDWTGTRDTAPHPWQAHWIWHAPMDDMDNLHLLARRVFTSPDGPASARCRIACNSLYELWINGVSVGRGPNPSFPGALYYDSYDLTDLLRPGRNVVAVRCYNFGPTMQSTLGQNPGPGGLRVEIESAGRLLVQTDHEWRLLQDPSRQQRTDPISGHRGGFKEVCDGRRELLGWTGPDFDDSVWPQAHTLDAAGQSLLGTPILREIPSLRMTMRAPVDAFFHTTGSSYGGKKYDITRPQAVLVDDESFTVIDPLRPDFSPSLLLDFGRAAYGYFEIDITDGGQGGATLEVAYGESLNLTTIDRYTLRAGPQVYRPFERRGGRYLQLTFRNCTSPVRIRRVVCHEQGYPVEARGHFSCSDALLNRVWEVGCDTSRSNMQDHFEDAPWREQTLYAGDLYASQLLAFYAWGDRHLARKCLIQFARLQNDQGVIPLFGPAPREAFVLPEYPALWMVAIWHYHLHWDDLPLLESLWPAVERCLKWYADRLDSRGFFTRREGEAWGVFIDNLSNITAASELAAEQILYCQGLRSAAEMARRLGHVERADRLFAQSDTLAAQIERAYWSEEKGCLVDSLAEGGQGVTQITNGLALLFDIVSSSRRGSMMQVLEQRQKAPPVRAGYMAHHVIEALIHAGRPAEALQRIREYWGGMLARGAGQFWEVFDPESPDGSLPQRLWSLSHAFCAGPVYSLPARFAGIQAVEPGFAKVQIRPRIADLHWISATVPTPRGDIHLTYLLSGGAARSTQLDLVIPAGVAAELLLETPGRDTWIVSLNGTDLPLSHDGQEPGSGMLSAVHAQLRAAGLCDAGVRLEFAASAREMRLRCTIRQQMGAAGRRIIVAEPAGNWDAAPKPV